MKRSINIRKAVIIICLIIPIQLFFSAFVRAGLVSEATETCLDCHISITPGIVADWQKSSHAQVSMEEALAKSELEKRISSSGPPDDLQGFVIGCAECHMINNETHTDSFDHNDYTIHTVVSPPDCATCHAIEWDEYQKNIMSKAYFNLMDNPLYLDLVNSINGVQHFTDGELTPGIADDTTNAAACLACHGTRITVDGFVARETDLGEMTFPELNNWPNQGVGRINPDGSIGSCTSCHARHQFSIELARKPATCAQCHKGPDVPAYKVYQVSKHGNIYSAENHHWDFNAVPWTIGKDFNAPTCAVCHISLLIDEEETVIAARTHQMSDRLDKRIFGLIYSHPHPIDANTSIIKNKAGIPLPTELTGEPVDDFLIDGAEQEKRLEKMKTICQSCHSSSWTDGHFVLLDRAIETTNDMTLSTTKLINQIWEEGYAQGLPQGKSVFDEAIEKKWVEQWLFYANSVRFSAAMAGADYGVFANGRWQMSKNLREIHDWLKIHQQLKE